MSTCKDCEYYEPYNGDKHGIATWHCKNKEHTKYSAYDGYWTGKSIWPCSDFTPKKPKEERNCFTCRLGRDNPANNSRPCILHPDKPKGTCGIDFLHWQPMEKPKEEKGKSKFFVVPIDTSPGAINYANKPNKVKENKMRLRFLPKFTLARYVMLCVVIVTAKIGIFLKPYVCWLAILVHKMVCGFWHQFGDWTEAEHNWERWNKWEIYYAFPWVLTLLVIVGILFALWLFNKATKWLCRYLGEKK